MAHRLAKYALAPLLLGQALRVRRNALKLPEAQGPRTGVDGKGPPLRLVILGDSSAAGVGVAHQKEALAGQLVKRLASHREVTWQLHARTGATTKSSHRLLCRLPAQRYDAALVVLGVNDVTALTSPKRWRAQQLALHQTLQDKFGVRHIFCSGLPPMAQFPLLPQPLRWVLGQDAAALDAALNGLCAQNSRRTHIPLALPFTPDMMAEDGFHPAGPAYATWAALLAPIILQKS
ncbi:SGNH/GDSL hydrolase family protein [uncultured Lentibacter sp.]|uniref:SGNH/GDSL hydrolase family protein n=1 Tax=uncultured Lentibacter sp. TaxID=1659309 RepID=UPI00260EF973|nr:SGNH/GDSL hydrolase family protein [uncultured Lentibacter sp.]